MIKKPDKFFSSMRESNIVVLSLCSFLSKVSRKGRFPIADISGCIADVVAADAFVAEIDFAAQ